MASPHRSSPRRSASSAGLAQVGAHSGGLAEREERVPELEAEVDGLLERVPSLREVLEGPQRLLEEAPRLRGRRSGPDRLGPGLAEVGRRPSPTLAREGVVGQPLDMLGEAIG